MSNLKDFKKRIISITSTKKLTHAMQLIAANKLTKYHNIYTQNLEVKNLAKNMLLKVLQTNPHLLKKHSGHVVNRKIAIIITSDKGLCGGYNSNIVKDFKAELGKFTEGNTKLIVIGKKGQKYFKDFDDVEFYLNSFNEYDSLASVLAEKIEEAIYCDFSSVSIYFNDYKNFVTHEYCEQVCWPLKIQDNQDDYILEKISYKEFLRIYLKTSIINTLLSSATSELAARAIAMDNASRNAGSLIDKLTLQFNRSRQEIITKELIEIIAGAEAL